jgi:hypothetical protein
MTKVIRWLKDNKFPHSPKMTQTPEGFPDVAQSGGHRRFQKGEQTAVHVRGSNPIILSKSGFADLRGIIEGTDFGFVGSD